MSTPQHIISNFHAFFEYLSQNSTSELKVNNDFSSVNTINSVWPNFTFNLRLETETAKNQLKNLIKAIDNAKTPNYIIIDEKQVNQYEAILTELDFIPIAEWACLAFEEKTIIENNPEIVVKKIESTQELNQWIAIASKGFGKLDFSLFQHCFKNKEVAFYAGYHLDKMVTTAMLFFDNKTAGIYHVVTLPQHKKKGFGSQIFRYCQEEAILNGATKIIAQSTQEGLNAWKNTGMKQYGNFYLFCWNKPKS